MIFQKQFQQFLASVAATLCLGVAYANGETYTIKLSRPTKVGDSFTLRADTNIHIHNVMAVDGKPPLEHDFTILAHLKGEVKILAVNSGGDATKLSCNVDEFRITWKKVNVLPLPGANRIATEYDVPPLPDGDVIVSEYENGSATCKSQKGELTEDQWAALRQLLKVQPPDSPTFDDIFGTANKQEVGAKWPINAAAAAKRATFDENIIDPKNIKGDVIVTDVGWVAWQKCLTISASQVADDVEMKQPLPLPPELTDEKVKFTYTLTSILPVDLKAKPVSETFGTTREISGRGVQADHISFKITSLTETKTNRAFSNYQP